MKRIDEEERRGNERGGDPRREEGRREERRGQKSREGGRRGGKQKNLEQKKEILVSGLVGIPPAIVKAPQTHPDPDARFCYIYHFLTSNIFHTGLSVMPCKI